MSKRAILAVTAAVALTTVVVAGCSGSGGGSHSGSKATSGSSSAQRPGPAPTESNPPGDIPDNQVYVAYRPPAGGFTVKVPEGWARSSAHGTTTFSDKLNKVEILRSSAGTAPTVQSVKAGMVPALRRQAPHFSLGSVTTVHRKAGQAIRITYQTDSAPDPVTGKAVRDSVERYVFFHNGREAVLTLTGPTGADNVDPWRVVSDSLRWQ
ncbi:hypothetical protein GTZ89_28875 [Streptomyces sp. SID8382]|uniref:hypothetical protein n=1 Tax=Streptomyces malaysiensis TaxID=92644 RepID=UPI000C2BCEF9|nr:MULTISPECIES: hypothetical protein [unclassified Streptomyces]AUA08596.1 hypothetical protein CFP59_00682 [Streptomyces sp. M56]MYX59544.1 hypothetical protein [Streptomyces sp. SID8382]